MKIFVCSNDTLVKGKISYGNILIHRNKIFFQGFVHVCVPVYIYVARGMTSLHTNMHIFYRLRLVRTYVCLLSLWKIGNTSNIFFHKTHNARFFHKKKKERKKITCYIGFWCGWVYLRMWWLKFFQLLADAKSEKGKNRNSMCYTEIF